MIRQSLTLLLAVWVVAIGGLPVSDIDITTINSTAESLLTKRECRYNGAIGLWDCNRKFVPMSRFMEKIREFTGGANTPAIFYSNLRLPTEEENPLKKKAWFVHQVWIESWLNWRGIGKHYSYFNAIDEVWLEWQIMESKYFPKEMDQSGLDKSDPWPWPRAVASHPDAYLFTPKGGRWLPESSWERVEYWKLAKNENVKRIWRVDPTPGLCDYEPELMFHRDDNGEMQVQDGSWPLAEGWKCPVKEPAAQQPPAAPPANPPPAPEANPQPPPANPP